MDKAISWVKKSVGICSKAGQCEDEELIKCIKECEEELISYDKTTISNIKRILSTQFGLEDYLFIMSFFTTFMKNDFFMDDLIEKICQCKCSSQIGSMLEFQMVSSNKARYSQLRKLHKKNIDQFMQELYSGYPYLPVEKRNKKKIVIVTEQILSPRHAPTRQVLNYAYALQKALGYEVILFACPSDGCLPVQLWYVCQAMGSVQTYRENIMSIEYNGENFRGYQINMTKESNKEYNMMLSIIHAINPIFVLSMGTFNPVLDVINSFTTVVSKAMNAGFPVSEADVLLKVGREVKNKEDLEYIQNNTKQKILYIDKIATLFEDGDATFTRQQYNMPKEKFLLSIVGNRLNEEIDKTFVDVLNRILEMNNSIDIVFIGNSAKEAEYISELPKDRVILTGQVSDLMGVYKLVDLYINPKRGGGGHSSIMAMKSGVPIVTLPKCDVAYNAGESFVVEDYNQYPEIVQRYFSDKEFYDSQKKKAMERASKNNEEALIKDIDKLVKDILDLI